MKLKVGDRVRIRKDLEVDSLYGNASVREPMKPWIGKKVTVSSICMDGDFRIEEDDETWFWTPQMVENKVYINKIIFNDNATILLKDGRRYVTKCQAGDTYDREKGLLLCLAKANGYTYNDICEMLNNAEYLGKKPDAIKFDGVREIKRPAKVGEYVKVVNSIHADGYKDGDILEIVKVYNSAFGEVWYFYHDEMGSFLYEDEYVVLENYKPYKITLSEFWANKDKKNMAIHCKTDSEADELLKAFDRVGQVWKSGDKYTELNMGGKDVCYTNNNTCYNYNYREIAVANIGKIKLYKFNEVDLNK